MLILFVFILLVLSLFNGVFFHIPENYSSLIVYVVDFDGLPPYQGATPLVGPQVVQATEALAQSQPHLGYIAMPPSNFDNDPIAVRQAVYDFKAHAAARRWSSGMKRTIQTGQAKSFMYRLETKILFQPTLSLNSRHLRRR